MGKFCIKSAAFFHENRIKRANYGKNAFFAPLCVKNGKNLFPL